MIPDSVQLRKGPLVLFVHFTCRLKKSWCAIKIPGEVLLDINMKFNLYTFSSFCF